MGGNTLYFSLQFSALFYCKTHVKNKTVKRLWINSLEVDEIQKGFRNLRDNKEDLLLFERASARQYGDWLVGMNCSVLFTLLTSNTSDNSNTRSNGITLSIGRVQSPLVYMIYEQQMKIENFKSEPFYEVVGKFEAANGKYEGKAKVKEKDKRVVVDLLNQLNIQENEAIDGVIKHVEKNVKHEKSPKLHSLSTLQTVANKKWKYSPDTVLKTMQSLYEKKLVTYPRTDCNYITDAEFAYLSNNVEGMQQLLNADFEPNKAPNKRFVDNKKVQEHYAIVVTKKLPTADTINSLSDAEKNIFYEVLRVTLAMFHRDYTYEETVITTDVNTLEFTTKGRVEVDKGWKTLFINDEQPVNEKTNAEKVLPSVSIEEKVLALVGILEGHTTPPKPFTEGALINLMKTAGKMVDDEADADILKEVEGIGTEATRASIIETVKNREYIKIEKNIVSITDKGRILCEAIKGTLLASPAMTAKWETYLQKIGKGEGTKENFLRNIEKFIKALIEETPKRFESQEVVAAVAAQQESMYLGDCPSCNNGKLQDKKAFIGCNQYTNGCKFSINKVIASKKLTAKNIQDLILKGQTTKIKGFKSKAGKEFEAKLVIAEGKVTFDFN